MKKIGLKSFALLFSMMMFICSIQVIHAEENVYSHSDSAISGDVTLKVEWNEPVLGQPTTFHVSATGGSGIYKFNMEAPSYTNPDVISYESVADPSRGEWTKYSDECTSQDYTFTMMASGTYNWSNLSSYEYLYSSFKFGLSKCKFNCSISSCPM